jgi:hypothetical protein
MKSKAKTSTKQTPIGIESASFPNRFLRGDGNDVNVQFGQDAYENWDFQRQSDGSYCIRNIQFNKFLSLDPTGCTTPNGSGCGEVRNQATSCQGDEKFKLVPVGNNFGIQSVRLPNAYIRADAGSVTSSTGSGGGVVNAQYYNSGVQPAQWELFKINIQLCDYSIGVDCYNRYKGVPALANNQQFLLRKEFILTLPSKNAGTYGKLLTQSTNTEGGLGRQICPYDSNSSLENNANATAKKVITPYNVNGNEADWKFLDGGEGLYWDRIHWCNSPFTKARLEAANDVDNPDMYYIRSYQCSRWYYRLYNAEDYVNIKADHDGYADKRVYYFALFIKN